MGVDPLKWGPGAWRFLHQATLLYPDSPSPRRRKTYRTFFRLLPEVLPCGRCRAHLRRVYSRMPTPPENRAMLIRWMYRVHARTNKDLHKRVKTPVFEKELAGIRAGWRYGLRDLVFSTLFNAPRAALPASLIEWLRAARRIVGSRRLPDFSRVKSRASALNLLARHHRLSKSDVLSKYRPWLSRRSRASSGLWWLSAARRRGSSALTRRACGSSRDRARCRRRSE